MFKMLMDMMDKNKKRKDTSDRCSNNFIISSMCGKPRRLAVAGH